MNKYLFILGFVGTALFTACSTADDLASDKPNETPSVEEPKETSLIVEASQNSEVPITLGVGQSRGLTRAVLNPDDANGNFKTEAGKYLGVFCLATGTQANESNIPTIIKNFKWNTDPAEDEEGLIVRMRNVPAKVTTDGTTSDVAFLDPEALPGENSTSYYYPMGNWLKYNFYAYYPWQPEIVDGKTTLSFSESQVLETYLTIDGSQDVIWGRAHPWNPNPSLSEVPTGHDPYCAKYFRLKRAEVGEANIKNYYPKFVFEHKLVQFKFFVKAANATVLTDLMTKNMQVTDMYIANAIYCLSLIVAQKDSTKNGVLKMKSVTPSTKKLRIKTNNADTDRFDQENPYGDAHLDNPLAITTSYVTTLVDELQAGVALTEVEANAYNSQLSGALKADIPLTAAQATAYNTAMTPLTSKNEGETLSADEANAYNATLTGHKSADETLTAGEASAFNAANGYVGYIMLPDPRINNDEFKYQLTLKVKYTVNAVDKTDIIAIDMVPPSGGFIAGKIYNILVNVQSPEQISAKAILQEWDDSPDVIEYGN